MAQKKRKTNEARFNKHTQLNTNPPELSEDELYERLEEEKCPLVLILDGIEDPRNLGACMRSADAAGVIAVIAPCRHAASITETVRRVSAGGADHVPFVQVGNLTRCMETLQKLGMKLVGTSDRAKQSLYQVTLTGPIGIVLGAEEKGIRKLTAQTCDELVAIPMAGAVECLNVSVATGVFLFEAVRQRS